MDRKRFQEVERLFHEALQVPEPERSSWLRDACGDDGELIEGVRSLLDRADAEDTWPRLDEAVRRQIVDAHQAGESQFEVPQRIGPYRIVREIGHGGMGVVHLAERIDVGKRVALKLLRTPLASSELRQRFERERRILAQLEHPHIAPLVDAGVTPDGTPFFAMELVEGAPITDYCAGVDLRGRLDLMLRLCDAVAYAHRHLVVHRDIKPANVLVTRDGRLKLVDFGVAKLLAAVDEDERLATATRIFTPVYAAPEQVTGQSVTTATDVYQLGALLYELFAGVPPFDPALSPADAMQAITERDPPRPSAAGSRAPGDVRETAGAMMGLGRGARGDLDGIVLKCMDKRPDRRYASVDALIDDLNRFLDGRTVRARPAGRLYQARRFAQRHLGVTVAAVAALAWAGTATLQSIATRRQRDRAEAAAAVARIETGKARAVTEFLVGLFEAGDPAARRADSITARDILDKGIEEASALDEQPDVQAMLFSVTGRINLNLGEYGNAESQLRRALAIADSMPAADSTLVSRTRYDLATTLVLVNRHAEAVPLLHDVIRQRLATDSTGDLLAHQAFNRLYASLHALGAGNEADSVFADWQRLIEGSSVADEEVALALKRQGQILAYGGDFERAIPVLREAVAMHRSVYGADHVNYADALDVLASILLESGDVAGADSITAEALALRRTQLAPPHAQLSLSLAHRGRVLRERGDFAAAEQLIREALAMERELGGTESLGYAARNLDLAILLHARGARDEAEARYRDIIDWWAANYGEDYPLMIQVELRLADVLRDAGRLDEAADLLESRYRRLTVSPGGGAARYINATLRMLVEVHSAAGRTDQAGRYRALLPDSLPGN